MAFELIYTSSQQGLKAGTRGFCTVACTAGMSAPLASMLESLCGYRHLFPPDSDKASLNPVVYSHLYFQSGGVPMNVLSRIADAGLDYSGRTNKICHHIVPESNELVSCGPATLLGTPNLFVTSWNEPSRFIQTRKQLPTLTREAGICHQWQTMTGDAGWGGVLAAAVELNRPVALAFRLGQEILPLFDEAIALLPFPLRWKATFSSFYTRMPPGISCLWKAVLAGSTEEGQVRAIPGSIFINIANPGSNANQYASLPVFDRYIKWARSGVNKPSTGLKEVPNIAVAQHVAVPVAVPSANENPDLFYNDTAIDLEHLSSIPLEESSLPKIYPDYARNRPLTNHSPTPTKKNWILATVLILFVVLGTIGLGVGIWFYWPNIMETDSADSPDSPQQVAGQTDNTTPPVAPSETPQPSQKEQQGRGVPSIDNTKITKKSNDTPVDSAPVDQKKEKKPEKTENQKAEPVPQKLSATAPNTPVPTPPQQEKNTQQEKSPAPQTVVPSQPNFDHFKAQAKKLLEKFSVFRLPLQTGTDINILKIPSDQSPEDDKQLCKDIIDFCRANKIQLELSVIPYIQYKKCKIPEPLKIHATETGFVFNPVWTWENQNYSMEVLSFVLSPEEGFKMVFNNKQSGYKCYLFNPFLYSKLRWRFLNEKQEELASATHQLLAPIQAPHIVLPLSDTIDFTMSSHKTLKVPAKSMWDQFDEHVLLRDSGPQIAAPKLLSEKKDLNSESPNSFNPNELFSWECKLVKPTKNFDLKKVNNAYSLKYTFHDSTKEVLQTGLFLNWKEENGLHWKTFFYFYNEKKSETGKESEKYNSLPLWLTIPSTVTIALKVKQEHHSEIETEKRQGLNEKYKIEELQKDPKKNKEALEKARSDLKKELTENMEPVSKELDTIIEGWKGKDLVISYKIFMKKETNDKETICIMESTDESTGESR